MWSSTMERQVVVVTQHGMLSDQHSVWSVYLSCYTHWANQTDCGTGEDSSEYKYFGSMLRLLFNTYIQINIFDDTNFSYGSKKKLMV